MSSNSLELLSDTDLLRRFTATRSQEAFAVLVNRHLPMIYSSALRQTRNPQLAEDIAQATLIVVSQRAHRIDPPLLVGWLIKTTHFVAGNAIRQQYRRAKHEQRAAVMKRETQTAQDAVDPDAIAKVIDLALAKLRDIDRTAVVLRYFQNKSFADIAALLNTNEGAVQKRISRAIQKLRDILAGEGITVAPAALPALLGSLKLHPVPPSLFAHAATVASTKSASTSLLAKGVLKTMVATKLKISAAAIVAILFVGASVPVAYEYLHQPAQAQLVKPSTQSAELAAMLPKGTDLSKATTGSLPRGVKVQIIAIMRIDDGKWLSPTGGPATDLPFDADQRLSDLNTQASYAFLYSISQVPELSVEPHLVGAESRGWLGWSNFFSREYAIAAFDPANGSDSVQLAINAADGAWQDIAVMPASSNAEVDGTAGGEEVQLFPVTQDNQGVHIRSRLPNVPSNAMRLVGIDTNGKPVNSHGMFSNDKFSNFTFAGKPSDFTDFRVQTRPYNYHATLVAVPLPH